MRRLFAFIALAISMVAIAVVGIPSINSTLKSGTEFDGGYSVLYQVTTDDGVSYQGAELKSKMNQATSRTNERLNALNISLPEVTVEGDDYIRVTVPYTNETELGYTRYALLNNSSVTLRGADDSLYGKGDDIFSSVFLYASNDTVYLTCKVKDGEKLEEACHMALSNPTEGEDGSSEYLMMIWVGFEETYTDTMKELTGFDGDSYSNIQSNSYTQFKLLSAVNITQEVTTDFTVNAYAASTNIDILNTILEQKSVLFTLSEISASRVGSIYGEDIPLLAIIAICVGILAIAVLMFVEYKFAGISAILSIITHAIVVLFAYSKFGGLFGSETIIALMISVGIGVDANVVFLERIKDELRKGKALARAYDEGSKKSVSAVLDSNVLIIVAALAFYLFGNQIVKSFSAILILTEVSAIIIVVVLTRFMLSLICHSSKFANKPEIIGVKAEEIVAEGEVAENKSLSKFEKFNFFQGKKVGYISAGIVAAGVVVGLLFTLISGSFFNTSLRTGSGTHMSFVTVNPDFGDEEKVKAYFADEDVAGIKPVEVLIYEDKIVISDAQKANYVDQFEQYNIDVNEISRDTLTLYSVSVTWNKEIGENAMEGIREVFQTEADCFYDEDEDSSLSCYKNSFAINSYESYSASKSYGNLLLAIAMMIVFIFVYLTIRFTWSYSLTTIATIIHNLLLVVGACAAIRVQMGVEIIAILIACTILTIISTVGTFDRLRENVAESKNVVWTKETRKEFISKSLKQTMFGKVITFLGFAALAILVLAFTGFKLTWLSIAYIFALAAAYYGSVLIMPYIWVYLDTLFAKWKEAANTRRAIKQKALQKERAKEVQEYVFFGIND